MSDTMSALLPKVHEITLPFNPLSVPSDLQSYQWVGQTQFPYSMAMSYLYSKQRFQNSPDPISMISQLGDQLHVTFKKMASRKPFQKTQAYGASFGSTSKT